MSGPLRGGGGKGRIKEKGSFFGTIFPIFHNFNGHQARGGRGVRP